MAHTRDTVGKDLWIIVIVISLAWILAYVVATRPSPPPNTHIRTHVLWADCSHLDPNKPTPDPNPNPNPDPNKPNPNARH